MSDHDHKHDEGDCGGKDMLVAGPDIGGGYRPFSRHLPDHSVVEGIMRPVREGENLLPGAMAIHPRNDGTPICDVEDIEIPGQSKCADCAHKGPARVSTPAFRDGWDRIFGGKSEVGQA